MPLSVRHSHSPFLAALSYIRRQAVGRAYGTGARKLAPSPSAPPSACWGRCPQTPIVIMHSSIKVFLFTILFLKIITCTFIYFYDIYNSNIFTLVSFLWYLQN